MKAKSETAGKTATAGETAAEVKSGARVRPLVGGAIRIDSESEYDTQARAFLEKTGARVAARYLGEIPDDWDKGNYHAAYRVTISSESGKMIITFHDSLKNTWDGKRSIRVYDVLSCLMKSEPGAFDDFCTDMGFFPMESGADYRKAVKAWRGCCREYAGVCRVWPCAADREALAEIN